MSTTTTLKEVLQKDQESRQVGITDDLHSLGSVIEGENPWDYSSPTLTKSDLSQRRLVLTDDQQFQEAFNQSYGFLSDIFRSFPGIVIAGGSVSNLLMGNPLSDVVDVDLFFIGMKIEQANQTLDKLIRELLGKSQDGQRANCTELYKNGNCVCFTIRLYQTGKWQTYQVQVILRMYHSISELLHAFDLGSCGVAYDGQRLYFTTLSKYCYQRKINLVIPSRRSPSYESRLCKYLNRGFEMVLPELELSNMSENTLSLPHLEASLVRDPSNRNRLVVENFERIGDVRGLVVSDYAGDNYYRSSYFNPGSQSNHQLRLLAGEMDNRNRLWVYSSLDQLLSGECVLSEGELDRKYNSLWWKLKAGEVNRRALKRMFNQEEYQELVSICLLEDPQSLARVHIIVTTAKERMLNTLRSHQSGVRWVTENPGGEVLTGSFNPAMETNEAWYGSYYRTSGTSTTTSTTSSWLDKIW